MLAAAAAGLGHATIAYDRDGAPRYDYAALPFEADFLPSLPIRAAAAYLGVAWPEVALALGTGVHIGDLTVPTDRAMRLLINYRGPRNTFPSFSFADLLAGHVAADKLAGRVVLIGASFVGSGDSYAQPFGSTPMPGVERMANIIDTIISRDFIVDTVGHLEHRRNRGDPADGGVGRSHDRIPADPFCGTRRGDTDRRMGRRRAVRFCEECVAAARRSRRLPWRPPPRQSCCSATGSSIATAAASARPSASISRRRWSPAGGPSGALAAGRRDAAGDDPVLRHSRVHRPRRRAWTPER